MYVYIHIHIIYMYPTVCIYIYRHIHDLVHTCKKPIATIQQQTAPSTETDILNGAHLSTRTSTPASRRRSASAPGTPALRCHEGRLPDFLGKSVVNGGFHGKIIENLGKSTRNGG